MNTSQKLIGRPVAWLETVGAVCLFAMMAVTFFDVLAQLSAAGQGAGEASWRR